MRCWHSRPGLLAVLLALFFADLWTGNDKSGEQSGDILFGEQPTARMSWPATPMCWLFSASICHINGGVWLLKF